MDSVDVHQHLWPEPVLEALERRALPPKATWSSGRWRIALPGEPSFDVRPEDHDPGRRAGGLDVDRALVALSAPVGAEGLPARDALAVVAAWHDSASELPGELGWWAASCAALGADDEADVARGAVSAGAAGLCLPAGRLRSPRAAEEATPVLAAAADTGTPVFVHPGPAAGGASDPGWWSPATSYVAQQHAAWHAFHAAVRPALPELRVVFALLAGLAPLGAERTAARGGPAPGGWLSDPLCFYETSSYGPRAVRALVTAVGIGQLVHGTDFPAAPLGTDPVKAAFGAGVAELVRRDGPARALGYAWVPV